MSRAVRVSLVAIFTAVAGLGAQAPASAAANSVNISVSVDGHCWRYYWGSGYLVEGYTQSNASFSGAVAGVVTGTVSASASSTGGTPDSDNGAADGVLTTSASAHANSSGTPQTSASHHTVGASVRPSSPFPGLPSYVGGSAAFTCATTSSAGIDVTKSCSMTYTLNPVSLRWSRTSGSAGSCTVV